MKMPVRKRTCRLVVLLGLVLSLGLHWTLLQSVAWMGMMVSYSQQSGLATAFEMTFDGRHPCELCKAVEKGSDTSSQDNQQQTASGLKKLDCTPHESDKIAFFVPPLPAELPSLMAKPEAITTAPPVPPPRAA